MAITISRTARISEVLAPLFSAPCEVTSVLDTPYDLDGGRHMMLTFKCP